MALAAAERLPDSLVVPYLNRLADLLFVMARVADGGFRPVRSPLTRPVPIGTDTDRLLRDNRTLLELLSLGAVAAILIGVQLLADTDIGSSWAGGLAGVASQLGRSCRPRSWCCSRPPCS